MLTLTSAFLNSQSLELKNEFKVTKRLFKEKKFYDALYLMIKHYNYLTLSLEKSI